MTNAFDPINLRWKGKDYTIQANRVLMAIAAVEDVLPLHRITVMASTGEINLARISMAYGAVLRFAGAEVADEDVMSGLIGSPGEAQTAALALQTLLMMMLPRDLRSGGSAKAPPGKEFRKAKGSSSSRKRTKPSSVAVA